MKMSEVEVQERDAEELLGQLGALVEELEQFTCTCHGYGYDLRRGARMWKNPNCGFNLCRRRWKTTR